MYKSKIKLIILISSYVLFVFCILVSVNAVVPEKNLPVFELESTIIENVDNEFARNKNSVYEILEKKNPSTSVARLSDTKSEKQVENVEKIVDGNKILVEKKDKEFKIQLASFKNEQKSLNVSKSLQKKISKTSSEIILIVKKVDIPNKQTFFRVLTKTNYSFETANNKCNKLKENKIDCIVIKDNDQQPG